MPEIIRTLIDRLTTSEPSVLPEELRIAYGGDLWFPSSGTQRPYVIGNFATTVDGVVSYEVAGKSDSREIQMRRFVDYPKPLAPRRKALIRNRA